jgi:hypothetical protein
MVALAKILADLLCCEKYLLSKRKEIKCWLATKLQGLMLMYLGAVLVDEDGCVFDGY